MRELAVQKFHLKHFISSFKGQFTMIRKKDNAQGLQLDSQSMQSLYVNALEKGWVFWPALGDLTLFVPRNLSVTLSSAVIEVVLGLKRNSSCFAL